MAKQKSSISKASSYKEIGEFWDTHDLNKYGGHLRRVKFEIAIKFETTVVRSDPAFWLILSSIANR